MGRYAFFQPTEIEYKFRFAVQPSSDMRRFGGIMRHEAKNADLRHEWEKVDMDYILEELQSLVVCLNIEMPNFASYEKNVDGTYEMKVDLYHVFESKQLNEELFTRFTLGCVIYHQLLYVDKLTVLYET